MPGERVASDSRAPGLRWNGTAFVAARPARPERSSSQGDLAQALVGGQGGEHPIEIPDFPQPPTSPALPPPPPQQGPQLARPVSNAGSNGSNARYFVGPGSGLQRGTHEGRELLTDGVYWYDENGLSWDRPDSNVAGLGPANESENYDPWSGRGAQAAPAPPRAAAGPRTSPYGTDFSKALMGGFSENSEGADFAGGLQGAGGPQTSLAALLQALLGRVPQAGNRDHGVM